MCIKDVTSMCWGRGGSSRQVGVRGLGSTGLEVRPTEVSIKEA